MADFFPLMYVGFWINLLTGTVLMCLYPTDYVVDPAIYIKLAAVVVALVMLNLMKAHVLRQGDPEIQAKTKTAKRYATVLLCAWLVAIVTGRVIAYSLETRLQTAAAVLIALVAIFFVGYLVGRRLGWIESS
jgi:cobalamin synthase